MTTEELEQEEQASDSQGLRNRYDPAIAGAMALRLTRRDVSTGDAAGLRRMNPRRPDSTLYWRLMLNYRITDPDQEADDNIQVEQAWAHLLVTIAHGMRVGQDETTVPHDGSVPFGKALAQSGYQQARVQALLNAGTGQVQDLADKAARYLHSRSLKYNCDDLARLMLSPLRTRAQRDADRTYIARHYHREIYHQSQEGR